MSSTASCVHCLGPIRPPGLWSSSWQCDDDGDTLPYFTAAVPSARGARPAARRARCRSGCPSRCRPAGASARSAGRATSAPGPAPLRSPAAARHRWAGPRRSSSSPRSPEWGWRRGSPACPPAALQAGEGPGEAKVTAAHHPSPLWELPGATSERVGYAGEARGVWLATVFWPSIASLLLIEHMLLVDLGELPKGPNELPGAGLRCSERAPRPVARRGTADTVQAVAQAAPAGARPAIDAGP